MTISNKIRKLVFSRDENQCVACGSLQNLTIHHRVNRGAGGSKLFDSPAFLLTMCIICNGRFESDVDYARKAKIFGYKIQRNQKEIKPETIEVYYCKSNQWFLLNNKGEKTVYVQ